MQEWTSAERDALLRRIAPDVKLGKGVKIYDFVNLYGCEIGDNTQIGTFVEIQKGVKMPKEWLQSVIDSAKISKLGLPVVIPVAEFRDLVGAAITSTLAGADPAAELKKAHEQFRPILERSEKA